MKNKEWCVVRRVCLLFRKASIIYLVEGKEITPSYWAVSITFLRYEKSVGMKKVHKLNGVSGLTANNIW